MPTAKGARPEVDAAGGGEGAAHLGHGQGNGEGHGHRQGPAPYYRHGAAVGEAVGVEPTQACKHGQQAKGHRELWWWGAEGGDVHSSWDARREVMGCAHRPGRPRRPRPVHRLGGKSSTRVPATPAAHPRVSPFIQPTNLLKAHVLEQAELAGEFLLVSQLAEAGLVVQGFGAQPGNRAGALLSSGQVQLNHGVRQS